MNEEYLDYLYRLYEDITRYLNKKDKVADALKRQMIFDKVATPYYYWKNGETVKEKPDIDKIGLLNALKKKYSLSPTKDGLKLPGYLGREEFKRLADNMRLCGYHYDSEEKEFKKEVPAHV